MNRPSQVPSEATWCEEDSEWVLGPKDANDEYHGEVHYWRPDGTLVCVCTVVNGVPHGKSRRFHENGDVSVYSTFVEGELDGEQTWHRCKEPSTEGMPTTVAAVWRVKLVYDSGSILNIRYFLADDTEVSAQGEPLARHPETVPLGAVQVATGWVAGHWNASGQKHGELTYYDFDGDLESVQMWSEDQLHGALKYFYEDGVRRSSTEYQHGELGGSFEQYARSGAMLRRGVISNGQWSGPLEDFGPTGALLEAQTIELPDTSPAPAGPSAEESALFDSYRWPLANGAVSPNWSKRALGAFIAVGWGGHRRARCHAVAHCSSSGPNSGNGEPAACHSPARSRARQRPAFAYRSPP